MKPHTLWQSPPTPVIPRLLAAVRDVFSALRIWLSWAPYYYFYYGGWTRGLMHCKDAQHHFWAVPLTPKHSSDWDWAARDWPLSFCVFLSFLHSAVLSRNPSFPTGECSSTTWLHRTLLFIHQWTDIYVGLLLGCLLQCCHRAAEMAQRVRALVLPQDLSSVPSTYTRRLSTVWSSNCRGSNTSSWASSLMCTHPHVDTHRNMAKN